MAAPVFRLNYKISETSLRVAQMSSYRREESREVGEASPARVAMGVVAFVNCRDEPGVSISQSCRLRCSVTMTPGSKHNRCSDRRREGFVNARGGRYGSLGVVTGRAVVISGR